MSKASEREALLSCPFCRRIDFLGVEPGERGFLCIKCRGCGCAGPSNRAETEAEAIARWNHRAPTSKPAPVAAEPSADDAEGAASPEYQRGFNRALELIPVAAEPVAWRIVTEGGSVVYDDIDPREGYSQQWLDDCQSIVALYANPAAAMPAEPEQP